jgi:coenzyme F420 hydrogenase subunit beta
MPVLVTRAADMAQCRGMRMGYAPLLALLEPARAAGHKRLAVVGIPCQVYALRALEAELGFDKLYVIGTPCSDNTTTERFHEFLALLADDKPGHHHLPGIPRRLPRGAAFCRWPQEGHSLPATAAVAVAGDFFPLTCRTCVDYTNVLADITVGYMGGQGQQWLLVRNQRGQELLDLLGDEVALAKPGSAGKRHGPVKGFLANVQRSAGGLPLRRMPDWLRPVVGWLMPRVGPRGLEFARARVEMKAVESVVHLRREQAAKMKNMLPAHVWQLVQPYGLTPQREERP